jgi:preprotein translocase subunit SecE
MARDRQRAKQRQAERRERRLAQERAGGGPPADAPADASRTRARSAEPAIDERIGAGPPAIPGIDGPRLEPAPGIDPELFVGAPPEEEGRSDAVLEDEPFLDIDEEHLTDEEIEAEEEAERELSGTGEAGYEVRARRGRHEAEAHRQRSRVAQFLVAVWAELQRVQWPNRQALTTLTGVVLGFVLIAGGYLGLLDAIFSEIIQAIL